MGKFLIGVAVGVAVGAVLTYGGLMLYVWEDW